VSRRAGVNNPTNSVSRSARSPPPEADAGHGMVVGTVRADSEIERPPKYVEGDRCLASTVAAGTPRWRSAHRPGRVWWWPPRRDQRQPSCTGRRSRIAHVVAVHSREPTSRQHRPVLASSSYGVDLEPNAYAVSRCGSRTPASGAPAAPRASRPATTQQWQKRRTASISATLSSVHGAQATS